MIDYDSVVLFKVLKGSWEGGKAGTILTYLGPACGIPYRKYCYMHGNGKIVFHESPPWDDEYWQRIE